MDWIAATARKPHWTEWVSVKTDRDEYGEGFYHGDDWPVWCVESRWGLVGNVTHWKPQPAGPDFGGPCDEQSIPV